MTDNKISIEDDTVRGKYAREITWLLGENSLNWYASPSAKKGEIFIRPKGVADWDNTSSKISRVSLQVKDDLLSFGISGYFPIRVLNEHSTYLEKGYKYHDKEGNNSPQEAVDSYVLDETGKKKGPKGRFWYTKPVQNSNHIVNELKNIEPLLFNGNN